MIDKSRYRLLVLCFLAGFFVCGQAENLSAQTTVNQQQMTIGRYAEIVCLRMIAIAQSLLEMEKKTLQKLAAQKSVDEQKFMARLISARLQLRKLRHLSQTLDKKMSSSDPARARVESLRKKLFYFISVHRNNMKEISAKIDLSDLKRLSEQIVQEIEAETSPGSFEKLMIGNLDQAF